MSGNTEQARPAAPGRLARRAALGDSMSALALIAGAGMAGMAGMAMADDAEGVLGEVLVTAQKRSENVQDIPSSVSVFDGEALERLSAASLVDYAAYLPGFNINSGGTPGQTTITLRGIAPVGPGAVVGTYIDDTPLGSSSNYARSTIYALDLLPDDIERVEVLRGPQGTLYGAGSMGGLLKYALRDPNLQEFEARVGAETFDIQDGGDLGWGGRASLNVPLARDTVALRLSGFTRTTAAFTDNAMTGEEDINEVEQIGGRAALLFQPTENLSIKLGGLWQRTEGDNNAYTTLELTGVDPPTGEPSLGELNAFHPLDEPFRKDIDYYSLSVNWDVGAGTLVSATSYSDTQTVSVQDASQTFGTLYELLTGGLVPNGLSEFTLGLELEKWTQELRFVSAASDRFEWLAGAFYTEEQSANSQEVLAFDNDGNLIDVFAPFFAFARLPTDYKEMAVFGDATFKFSERFDVTAGVRWAQNEQEFRQISGGAILPVADVPGSSKEEVVTYMVSPRLHVNEDTMLYLRVASGYRPGGPNVFLPGVPPEVDADKLTNYEVGLKTQFADRRALLNAAVYYIDWTNIQQAVGFGGVSGLDNAGDATSQGVELETLFSVTERLRLGVNAAYTDATLDESPPELDNREGARLPSVPEWTASLTADYSFPLGDWTGRIGGGWRFVDEQDTQVITNTDNLSYVLPSYDVLDLNAELRRDRWTLRLYAKNVTDERAYTGGGVLVDGLNVPVQINVVALQPRTLGISLDVDF